MVQQATFVSERRMSERRLMRKEASSTSFNLHSFTDTPRKRKSRHVGQVGQKGRSDHSSSRGSQRV